MGISYKPKAIPKLTLEEFILISNFEGMMYSEYLKKGYRIEIDMEKGTTYIIPPKQKDRKLSTREYEPEK